MQNRSVAVAGAALMVVAGIAGCSSETNPPASALPPSTAKISINGKKADTTHEVTCTQVKSYTTIEAGEESAGVTAVVTGGDEVTAKQVNIRNLGGFTGGFWAGVIGDGQAHVAAGTYTITGTATGFNTDAPDKNATGTFEIRVRC